VLRRFYDQILLPTLNCFEIFSEGTASSLAHIIFVFQFGPPSLLESTAGVTSSSSSYPPSKFRQCVEQWWNVNSTFYATQEEEEEIRDVTSEEQGGAVSD
jgi:hypothetical protein